VDLIEVLLVGKGESDDDSELTNLGNASVAKFGFEFTRASGRLSLDLTKRLSQSRESLRIAHKHSLAKLALPEVRLSEFKIE
jgi:hypothetical protein